MVEIGFKYNMMDLQAAIGLRQMEKIEAYWKRREAVWNRYQEAFAGLPLALPAPPEPDTRHAYHLYTILVDPDRGPPHPGPAPAGPAPPGDRHRGPLPLDPQLHGL